MSKYKVGDVVFLTLPKDARMLYAVYPGVKSDTPYTIVDIRDDSLDDIIKLSTLENYGYWPESWIVVCKRTKNIHNYIGNTTGFNDIRRKI